MSVYARKNFYWTDLSEQKCQAKFFKGESTRNNLSWTKLADKIGIYGNTLQCLEIKYSNYYCPVVFIFRANQDLCKTSAFVII